METDPVQSRLTLTVCAALSAGAALVVAVGIIPVVRAASAPSISPESAVPAFWAAVGGHLLAALVIALVAALSKDRNRLSTTVLIVTGAAVLFLGFLISDAAIAFLEVGRSMRTVTALLFLVVVADVLAGALAIVTALRRRAR